jgi:hypothetical protein
MPGPSATYESREEKKAALEDVKLQARRAAFIKKEIAKLKKEEAAAKKAAKAAAKAAKSGGRRTRRHRRGRSTRRH